MSPTLRTEVTQLSIVSGTEQADSGDTGLVETSPTIPPGTGKGNLHLLVQVSGEPMGKEAIHRELIQVMASEFSHVPGGITNGLRQAIRAANDVLYQRNMEALPLWQRMGETCCAVLRGNDLHIGVAGEAQLYIIHKGDIRIFPPPPAATYTGSIAPEPQSLPPLGIDEFLPDVGLFHCEIEEGDLIILGSSGLAQIANQDRVARAAQGGLGALADTLRSLASRTDLSALLIEIGLADTEAIPHAKPLRAHGWSAPAQVKPTRVRDVRKHRPRPPAKGIAAGLAALLLALAARILTLFAGLAARIQLFFSWLLSSGLLGRLGRGLRAGLVGLFQGLGTLTERMLPESEHATTAMEVPHVRPTRGVTRAERSSRLPLFSALAIVAIAAGVSIGLVMRGRSHETQFSQFIQDAQSEVQAALTDETPAGTRQHLAQASDYVEQALQMKPGNADASAIQSEILLALDDVNRVVRLQFSTQIPFAGPPGQPDRVLLHDNQVYVLDPGTQQLRRYLLAETGAADGVVLLSPDNPPASLTVQEVTDFVWMEEGSGRETSNLLVLVNGSSLLQQDESQGFIPVSVADSEIWHATCLIDGYSGYLYVLDPQEDRILKYAPTGESYDSFPLSYFQADTVVDLEGATDMAIDGYIYVLIDKSILTFSGGLQEAFSLSGLDDQELENPVALFTSPETQHIYVADAGRGRIVQLTKEGAFVRQFLPPREEEDLFLNLQDISVDEARGQLIALTSDGLFVAPIQQPPSVIE